MQVQKIQEAFRRYEDFLRSPAAEDRLYLWAIQDNFQQHWDLTADPLAAMYDRSLQSEHSRRLWRRENYEPKRMMLAFMEMDEDYVRQMFKDLFNEKKDLGGRADRFVFHCDQLLTEYKRKHRRSIDNNHYHDDGYQMISLYLALRYPEQYSLYNSKRFRQLLVQLGTRNLPVVDDLVRFTKISRTLYKLMQKEEKLMDLHHRRLQVVGEEGTASLLVIYDLYMSVTKE